MDLLSGSEGMGCAFRHLRGCQDRALLRTLDVRRARRMGKGKPPGMESNGVILSRKLADYQANTGILHPIARTFHAAAVSIKTAKHRQR